MPLYAVNYLVMQIFRVISWITIRFRYTFFKEIASATACVLAISVIFISAALLSCARCTINIIIMEIARHDETLVTCTVGMTDHSIGRFTALFNVFLVVIAITPAVTIAWLPISVGIGTC